MRSKIILLLGGLLLWAPLSYSASTETFCDPSDCVTLLHMNGADTGTTFTDSTNRHTYVASGGAQTDTDVTKLGTATMLTDGTGDYITASGNQTDWDFGTGSFTIDFWFNTSNNSSVQNIMGTGYDTGWSVFYAQSTGELQFYAENSAVMVQAFTPSNNTWYHIAIVRDTADGTIELFVNGTSVGSDLDSTDIDVASDLQVGLDVDTVAGMIGNIDELRIVKGTAVYTSNFTPQTAEYSGRKRMIL